MDKVCPLFNAPCLEHGCKWYIHLLGNDPQTGVPKDEHDCAVAFLPILLIEGAQQTRQAGAAIESFRNEMVKANQIGNALMAHGMLQQRNEPKEHELDG